MATIECFLLRPATFAQETLRRFVFSSSNSDCPKHGYHTCSVVIGTAAFPLSDLEGMPGQGIEHGDPRWPTTCACGYQFKPEDEWQHNLTRLYWRSDHLAMRCTLQDAPPGALYYADWYDWKGPDGRCLVVVTPAGPWIVDGPSMNNDGSRGSPWTRTGEVPKVTASPSIHFPGKYHAWLKDGYLIDV
jgi:hypothetical protein